MLQLSFSLAILVGFNCVLSHAYMNPYGYDPYSIDMNARARMRTLLSDQGSTIKDEASYFVSSEDCKELKITQELPMNKIYKLHKMIKFKPLQIDPHGTRLQHSDIPFLRCESQLPYSIIFKDGKMYGMLEQGGQYATYDDIASVHSMSAFGQSYQLSYVAISDENNLESTPFRHKMETDGNTFGNFIASSAISATGGRGATPFESDSVKNCLLTNQEYLQKHILLAVQCIFTPNVNNDPRIHGIGQGTITSIIADEPDWVRTDQHFTVYATSTNIDIPAESGTQLEQPHIRHTRSTSYGADFDHEDEPIGENAATQRTYMSGSDENPLISESFQPVAPVNSLQDEARFDQECIPCVDYEEDSQIDNEYGKTYSPTRQPTYGPAYRPTTPRGTPQATPRNRVKQQKEKSRGWCC